MNQLTVRAPDDQTPLGTVARDDAASIDEKVRRAEAAMGTWAGTSPMKRAEILLRIADAARRKLPELAEALSKEQGKTRREATMELDRFIGPFVQYAGLATMTGGRHQRLGDGVEGLVDRGPVGVVAAVVPWNFPASLFGSKVAPALAAGCGFLIKPAETTSLITLKLAGIAQEFLPAGLLDVVIGGADVGDLLVTHPSVSRVAFTGSTAVGRQIAARAGTGLKRLTLELGGCDPFVVLEDADLKGAVRALMGTRFYNAGQVCVAPKRLIVHQDVSDGVIAALMERLERVTLGASLHSESTMGPLHTEAGRTKLEEQISEAVEHGAELLGGGRPEGEQFESGWFLRPGILLDPAPDARVRTEETFGPVLTVVRVGSDDEAVAVAKETSYSLGSSVWSADRERAWNVARRIPAGYTWINALARVYDELPFGGVGASGIGREHGIEALDSYLEDRTFVYA